MHRAVKALQCNPRLQPCAKAVRLKPRPAAPHALRLPVLMGIERAFE